MLKKSKLAGLESSKFKGTFISLNALNSQSAFVPGPGDYADVDTGSGNLAQRYIWDNSDAVWIAQTSTTQFTAAQVKTLYESNADTNAYIDVDKAEVTKNINERTSFTASTLLGVSASDKKIISLPIATYPSLLELTLLKGATGSTLQTQINTLTSNKVDKIAGKGLSKK